MGNRLPMHLPPPGVVWRTPDGKVIGCGSCDGKGARGGCPKCGTTIGVWRKQRRDRVRMARALRAQRVPIKKIARWIGVKEWAVYSYLRRGKR